MDLVVNWLIGPVALIATAVGLSLLVERLADLSVPWTIRPALGLAAAIVVAQFLTVADETAELAVPAILALAVLGLLLGWASAGGKPSGWAVGAAALVFLVFAAPFLASGDATWAGYIKLDDTGTFMGFIDHAFEIGRGVGNLPLSTHEAMIDDVGGNYPTGSLVPAATMSRLLDQDVAWTIQPSLAVAMPVMCLLIFELVRQVVRRDAMAAAIAVVASLSATLIGYYLWGGVKEIYAAALLPLGPALVAYAARSGWPRSIWVPLGVSMAAFIAVLGAGGGIWLLMTLLPALFLLVRARGGLHEALPIAAPALAVAVGLALPVLITPDGLLNPLAKNFVENTEFGNLTGHLNLLHISGIWPSLDFRSDPGLKPAVLAIGVLCLVLAAGALIACVRLGPSGVMFASYVAGGLAGAVVIIAAGSAWVDGKAMAIVSPAVLAAAGVGIALIWERTDFRLEATALAVVVAGVTAWSAYLAYHGVWLAPRSHYVELETIGERFEGDGPALATEVSVYGGRHFLRKMDAEGATDLRRRQVLLRDGTQPPDHRYIDLDDIRQDQLEPYRTLVLRRGPATSRPPASFSLVYASEHYEVWQRVAALPGSLVDHLPLGNPFDAGAVPNCDRVRALAEKAGSGGTLTAARVSAPVVVDVSAAQKPESWELQSPTGFIPGGSGTMTADVEAPAAGEYELWLGGFVFGGLELSVDGETVGSERAAINNEGGVEPLGTASLSAGRHTIELDYERGSVIHPGSGPAPYAIGPLTIDSASRSDPGTIAVPASGYRELCGARWDWIEAYS